MPYADKAKQRKAQAESAVRRYKARPELRVYRVAFTKAARRAAGMKPRVKREKRVVLPPAEIARRALERVNKIMGGMK